jgi:hypothetical protein
VRYRKDIIKTGEIGEIGEAGEAGTTRLRTASMDKAGESAMVDKTFKHYFQASVGLWISSAFALISFSITCFTCLTDFTDFTRFQNV